MNKNRYELLLDKNINDIEFNEEKKHYSNENLCSFFFFNSPKRYFNNSINMIFININDEEKITQIDIKFLSLINQELYDKLNEIYGEPNMVLVPDKIIYNKTSKVKRINLTVNKTKSHTKQGDFNDKPTFIIWEKKNYKVEILMKYQQNISEISFKKI